jgi:hypothetical protein
MRKIPSSKFQVPKKLQIPRIKDRERFWNLELGVSLELGTWNLELKNHV